MTKKLLSLLFIFIIVLQVSAQQKSIFGKVYAFKDLPLKNIQVVAKKAKTNVLTDSLGHFTISCEPKDKLEFVGKGFQKTSLKIENKKSPFQKPTKAKMIFNGGEKNIQAAISNKHVTEDKLKHSIETFPEYNYNYFNYTNIQHAIERIYAGNDNIRVSNKAVFVRTDNSVFSQAPAIFVVDGKPDAEVSDILMGNIEAIKILPDASAKYGLRASSGVVIISTFKD